jgi:hypothetical protein
MSNLRMFLSLFLSALFQKRTSEKIIAWDRKEAQKISISRNFRAVEKVKIIFSTSTLIWLIQMKEKEIPGIIKQTLCSFVAPPKR